MVRTGGGGWLAWRPGLRAAAAGLSPRVPARGLDTMKAVKPAPLLPTEALVRLADLDERDFNAALRTSGEQIERSVAAWQLRHHKENQLLYYEPVSDEALKLHRSLSRVLG